MVGKLELDTATFDLEAEIIFYVMDMLSPSAAQKHIDMAFYYADNVPKHAVGDALRFKQILTNLISNAIKFLMARSSSAQEWEQDDIDSAYCTLVYKTAASERGGTDRKKTV